MTRIDTQSKNDLIAGIAKRMECGESSPLCFRIKQSGDDSPHSIRFAISVTAIVSNPVHPIDNRSRLLKMQNESSFGERQGHHHFRYATCKCTSTLRSFT